MVWSVLVCICNVHTHNNLYYFFKDLIGPCTTKGTYLTSNSGSLIYQDNTNGPYATNMYCKWIFQFQEVIQHQYIFLMTSLLHYVCLKSSMVMYSVLEILKKHHLFIIFINCLGSF